MHITIKSISNDAFFKIFKVHVNVADQYKSRDHVFLADYDEDDKPKAEELSMFITQAVEDAKDVFFENEKPKPLPEKKAPAKKAPAKKETPKEDADPVKEELKKKSPKKSSKAADKKEEKKTLEDWMTYKKGHPLMSAVVADAVNQVVGSSWQDDSDKAPKVMAAVKRAQKEEIPICDPSGNVHPELVKTLTDFITEA